MFPIEVQLVDIFSIRIDVWNHFTPFQPLYADNWRTACNLILYMQFSDITLKIYQAVLHNLHFIASMYVVLPTLLGGLKCG
jgi:hypothetical protein